MYQKDKYLEENEVKVKNLLSEMYENESALLSRISKKREKKKELQDEIRKLEKDYENQKKLREDLTGRFEDLKRSKKSNWEDFRREYELILDFAEGDKQVFIEKVQSFINELDIRIKELEEKAKKSSQDARKKNQEVLDEIREKQKVMQKRLDEAKETTGDIWKEVRQWIIERTDNIMKTLKF